MKKTLIALAAVAVAGAASAQVTVSGLLAFGYEATESNTAGVVSKANGLAVMDGHFALSATEDLGNGLKVKASMEVLSRGRDTTIEGRDASITVSGGFGSFMIGSVDTGNGIIGLASAGAPVYGLDGDVITSDGDNDIAMYTSPEFGGMKASVALLDKSGSTDTLGMGNGATTQDATLVGVSFAKGPLAATADFTSYGKNSYTGIAADTRARLSASYDLGMVVLGAGYETRDTTESTNNTTNETLVGISAPLGAWTVGANYGTSKKEGEVKVSGYELGAKYALSKRTAMLFQYRDVDNKNIDSAINAAHSNNKYRVRIEHAF